MTISALCIFAGDNPQAKPDAAAEALRAAGYQVFRLPPELNNSEVEGDDFIEIRREGDADDDAIDALWADAERIVKPFGGDVDDVGAASAEPFLELTAPSPPRCAHCRDPGTPDRILLSIDVGERHVRLHNDCLGPWLDTLVEAGPRLDTLVEEPRCPF
jgi:hypothetical protein